LVSIPAKVYASANSQADVRFNYLHKDCGSRLKQQYFCPKDGEIVERKDMVRGYEFAKGQYVLFSEDELKALQAKATQTIEITEFIPTKKIDPIYFEKSYFLGPDKGGDRAYKLLSQALAKSGRSALAKYAARGKQYLVLLRPAENGLVMQQLKYEDEIRSMSDVPLGEASIKPAELELALQIIEQGVSDDFRPQEYKDDVRERTLEQIQQKVEGKEIAAEPQEEPKAQVIDLMEALKASLSKKGAKATGEARQAPRRAAKKAVKKRASKKKAQG
jgi:DNA end-binding protein Ku